MVPPGGTGSAPGRIGSRTEAGKVPHGKNTRPSDSVQARDASATADHLPSLREPDAYGAPQSSDSDDTPGRHATHPQSVSLSQSSLFTLSSTNATGGRREVGTAAWGVWAGCDCFDRDAALPAAARVTPRSMRNWRDGVCASRSAR